MSGKAVVLGFLGGAVALLAVLLLVSPRLIAGIEARIGGQPPDRAIIRAGELGGQEWVAATEVADGRGCVVVELDGATASEVCNEEARGGLRAPTGSQEEPQPLLGDLAVANLARDPRWFVSGVVSEDVPLVRLELSDGEELVLQPRGARTGFLAGYWVTLLAPEVAVERVVAIDLDERVLGVLECGDAVATRSGPAPCLDQSGGQG